MSAGPDLALDLNRGEVVAGGVRVPLSRRELVLMGHLLRRQGHVCSRRELLSDVWGVDFDPGTNVVDVSIRRLRVKLRTHQIETVRNEGYRLVAS